ncbi:hypothetical protein PILCRDRAFT_9040 [Piloderma croceum F 1598]|uniref:Uncharacterized protein n=1 Tax=Piloderma croceum (strain F 1598) TaxID=765440 RepID=A0A0C3B446_PILCF|nr:hypothetical protein PILCRDRAFT_9040 [Piloderma croceum F 1598]
MGVARKQELARPFSKFRHFGISGICNPYSSDGPVHVTSAKAVNALFDDSQLKKADKLRIYLLTIPLAKVPPILLAAVARGSKDSAEAL